MPHVSSAPNSAGDVSREALVLFLRSYRGTRPCFASGTLMSLQEGTDTSGKRGYTRYHRTGRYRHLLSFLDHRQHKGTVLSSLG